MWPAMMGLGAEATAIQRMPTVLVPMGARMPGAAAMGHEALSARQSVFPHTRYLSRAEVETLKRTYDAPLFDTGNVTATNVAGVVTIPASSAIQFFTAGIGQGFSPVYGGVAAAGPKTEVDTNMRVSGGQLSLKQAFAAYELGFDIFPALVAGNVAGALNYQQLLNDVNSIAFGFSVVYGSSSTALILGVPADWPGGAGAYGFTGGANGAPGAGTAQAFGAAVTNGFPAAAARFRLRSPKDFANGEDFRISINNPRAVPVLVPNVAGGTFVYTLKPKYWGIWRDKIG